MHGLLALVAGLSLFGCMGDDGVETCGEKYPNGYPGDPWRPPFHIMSTAFHLETLSCERTDADRECLNTTDHCYCMGTRTTNLVTTTVPCADSCTGLDEAACPQGAGCFVARDSSTNAFIGCYQAGVPSLGTPCSSHLTAKDCKDGIRCAGLYAPTDSGGWQFSACTDL